VDANTPLVHATQVAEVQKQSEEHQRYRRVLEGEVETLRNQTISKQEHQRALETHSKEVARLTAARVEAEFSAKYQV
jgi:hypothetical protein